MFCSRPHELGIGDPGFGKESAGGREHRIDRIGKGDHRNAARKGQGRVAGAGADVEHALAAGWCGVLDDQL